jgi:hypothetical protein
MADTVFNQQIRLNLDTCQMTTWIQHHHRRKLWSGAAGDQYYAKPLVYNPSNYGRQVVLAFSEANRIYVLDAQNGAYNSYRGLYAERWRHNVIGVD